MQKSVIVGVMVVLMSGCGPRTDAPAAAKHTVQGSVVAAGDTDTVVSRPGGQAVRKDSTGPGSSADTMSTIHRGPDSTVNGKICYLELPATDIARSADFYGKVFGWKTRTRSNGSTAFDDTVGQVSGSWVLGRPPAAGPGLLVYIMVDDAAATCRTIIANGGKIVQEIGVDAPEITARFTDPAGNVLGVYQQPA